MCGLQPHTGFVVVAGLAERLPVAFIPEKAFVAAMRDDVIHNRRGRERAVALAFRAQRMRAEETPPRRLPFLIIATVGGGFACVQRTMLFTVNIIREVRASRMAAGTLGLVRHTLASMCGFHASFVGKTPDMLLCRSIIGAKLALKSLFHGIMVR